MIKTLHIDSVIEGIRLRMKQETNNGTKVDFIATFGRGNLQVRLMLESLASIERSLDLFDVELVVEIDLADATSIKRVGHWIDKRTPAQQALFVHAKDKAVSPPAEGDPWQKISPTV
jgi:hypothetical protein